MDGPTVRAKVTVAKLTPSYNNPSPATSRPSSRNNSRPASPTKSFVSTSSPLATPGTTIRPKAKVNSSAIRRTPSSTTDNPVHPTRPPSPAKLRRDGTPVSVGTRTKPMRVKASSSISSVTSLTSKAKSPSPELRARSLTASSDTLRSNPADSRKRKGSASVALHHASSQPSLQAPPTTVPPVPPLLPGTRVPRVSQSELGVASDVNGVENHNAGGTASQTIKIRSKVTAMAKNLSDVSNSASLAPESPTLPMPSPTTSMAIRARTASISSNVSSSGPATSPPAPTHVPVYFPITTAVPAANPHRYAQARATPSAHASVLRSSYSASSSPKYIPSPSNGTDEFRPFARTSIFPPSPNSTTSHVSGTSLNGFSNGSYSRATGAVIPSPSSAGSIDPANVPLPPQSPPISSLSVSSKSSLAYDSGTSPESSVVSSRGASVLGPGLKKKRDSSPQSLRGTLDTLLAYASSRFDDSGTTAHESFDDESTVEDDDEGKVRAEAKSNRKIADLEITNRSLLAINLSLEKTKDRQAKEIRELKRKLRETRLILPPRAYRAVKSSLEPNEIGDDEEDSDLSSSDEDEEFHSADEGLNGNPGGRIGKNEEAFRRIKIMLENLLETGKKALEKTKEDYMDAKGGAKVLTAEEVATWRGDSGAADGGLGRISDSESHLDTLDGVLDDDDDALSGRLTRSHSSTPQPPTGNGSVISPGLRNSNFTPSTFSTTLSSPKPPPILITETF